MDFNLVMKKLLAAFESEGIRYALMRGFALGFWGVHRATVDIDFLVDPAILIMKTGHFKNYSLLRYK